MANVYHKGNLIISAGAVHDRVTGKQLARAEGGKVVRFYENNGVLVDEVKQLISAFVEEAAAAPEN